MIVTCAACRVVVSRFATLDALVAQRGALGLGSELPATAAAARGALDALTRRALARMAGFVPLPVIVTKIVADHAAAQVSGPLACAIARARSRGQESFSPSGGEEKKRRRDEEKKRKREEV